MYFYLNKQSHHQHCKFLTFLFISTRRLMAMDQWNTEIFIESKSWLFKIPSGMAVNIIFWSREAKFSGFPNGKNHIQHFTLFYMQGSVLITFHRFCQKWQWISSKWKFSGYSNRNPKYLFYFPSKMAVNINNWSREAKFSGFSNGQLSGILLRKEYILRIDRYPSKIKV